jgi:uncharacterized protein (TIGR00369 family)
MSTLGAEIVALGDGLAELRLPFSAAVTQQNAFVHAGAITAVLDTACGCAAFTKAPQGTNVLTVEFKVNLLSPATGEFFVARAQVKRAGRTLTVCTADAYAVNYGNEKIVATMIATIMTVPE